MVEVVEASPLGPITTRQFGTWTQNRLVIVDIVSATATRYFMFTNVDIQYLYNIMSITQFGGVVSLPLFASSHAIEAAEARAHLHVKHHFR